MWILSTEILCCCCSVALFYWFILWFVFWVSLQTYSGCLNSRLKLCSAILTLHLYNLEIKPKCQTQLIKMKNQYYQSCKLTFQKRKRTDRRTYAHTSQSPHTLLRLPLVFCQVSDFVVVGWMFWTLESVTGTFPSPGVGALIMGVPVTKTVHCVTVT